MHELCPTTTILQYIPAYVRLEVQSLTQIANEGNFLFQSSVLYSRGEVQVLHFRKLDRQLSRATTFGRVPFLLNKTSLLTNQLSCASVGFVYFGSGDN